MRNNHTLSSWVERFFVEHIVTERNLALNTQKSYLDTFKLLVPFVCAKLRKSDNRLAVHDITSDVVLQFLSHLENDRGCSGPDSQSTLDGRPCLRPLRRRP